MFGIGMVERAAIFSPCRQWRYTLVRIWDSERRPAQFICLNPSTADETHDDPTVRRCINFAQTWGFGGMVMTNLFAYRATDPKQMKAAPDPVGPDNDLFLYEVAFHAGIVVAAWGVYGSYRDRDKEVLKLLGNLPVYYLTITKDGRPGHPLYLRGGTKPILWCPGENGRPA
jgi:hypothetical protein